MTAPTRLSPKLLCATALLTSIAFSQVYAIELTPSDGDLLNIVARSTDVDPNFQLTVSPGETISEVKVFIEGFIAGDTLDFDRMFGIDGGFDNANELALTMSGNATTAEYLEVIRSVRLFSTSPGTRTIRFLINGVEGSKSVRILSSNAAPTSANKTITILEDETYTFSEADFSFSDSDGPDARFDHVRIATGLAFRNLERGHLTLNNQEVVDSNIISADELGNMTFTPEPQTSASPYNNFKFRVNDGFDESGEFRIDINVLYVNDIPVINTSVGAAVVEHESLAGDEVLSYTATDEEDEDDIVSDDVVLINNTNDYYGQNSGSIFITQAGINRVNEGKTLPNVELSVTDSGNESGLDQETGFSSTAINTTFINDAPTLAINLFWPLEEDNVDEGTIVAFIVAEDEETEPNIDFTPGTNASALYQIMDDNIILTAAGAERVNTGGALPAMDITVTDSENSALQSSVAIFPNIIANNDTPEITLNLGLPIREREATNGTFVASYSATDEDGVPTVAITPGTNSRAYYTLIGNNIWLTQAGADQVNNGGALPLISVTATDDTDSNLKASDSKTPDVRPFNFTPELTLNLGSDLLENSAVDGTDVATFTAEDADGTPSVGFTSGTNTDNYFTIRGNKVELTQAGADHVNTDNTLPPLSLTATDSLEDDLFDIETVNPITVSTNDTPEITLTLNGPTLEGSATNNTVVASFLASDEEGAPSVRLSASTESSGLYEIVGNNIELTRAGADLVNGSGQLPSLTVTAVDAEDSSITASDTKTPTISPFNDRPTISLTIGDTVVEDQVSGGEIIAQFLATDEDGEPTVSFTNGSNINNYYRIVDASIVLSSAGADFVNTGGILPAIELTAVDDADDALTQDISRTPTTQSTNDAPIITLSLQSDLNEEDATDGTPVARFVASDEDGSPIVTITSGSNNDDYYRLQGTTVVLTQDGAELVNTGGALPSVSLTATDDSDSELIVVVEVIPVIIPYNDSPAIALTLANPIVENSAEQGSLVATYEASDEDGSPLVAFTSGSNTDTYYAITGNTIELSQMGADFVNAGGSLPTLSLTATDDLDSSIQVTDEIRPTVTSFNDTPEISVTLNGITEGNTVDGTTLGRFTASDEDGTPSVDFTIGSNSDGYYKLAGNIIQLTQAGADFVNTGGTLPAVSLTATDDTDPELTATESKTPVITAFNDLPIISITLGNAIVENSATDKLVIASIAATDEDGTPIVGFTSGTNLANHYRIVGTNVELTQTGADFVNDGGTLAELNITATDDADSNAKVNDTQTPIITPVNDAPEISLSLGDTVKEDYTSDETVVASFTANDEDGTPIVSFTAGTNINALYEIVGNNIELTLAGSTFADDTVSLPEISLTVTDDTDAQLTATDSVQPIVIENDDKDFDGILNSIEGTGDQDGDGIPNQEDTDSDNDGILDIDEGISDSDGDGTADFLDSSKDEDGDGVPDIVEGTADTDGDEIPNFLDTDSDNDGISDGIEVGVSGLDSDGDTIDDFFDFNLTSGSDLDNDGVDESIYIPDSDKDGMSDYLDIDSDNDRIPDFLEYLLAAQDPDQDGKANHLDPDSDNDGISDTAEANASGLDSDDDGLDDAFDVDQTGGVDADNNGIDDAALLSIPDTDGDGAFDLHDLDTDNDGLFDSAEANVTDDDTDGIANPDTPLVTSPIDTDNDGLADFRDLDSNGNGVFDIEKTGAAPFDTDNDGQIDITSDVDGDGIDGQWDEQPQVVGSSGDLDADGVIDSEDSDMDGDGIPNLIEGNSDIDGDGLPNHIDLDSDNDSIPDATEGNQEDPENNDSDNDGIPNTQDLDSDSDGISDITEFKTNSGGNNDMDQDGILDYLDRDSDNDGLSDAFESRHPAPSGDDTDYDGIDDTYDASFTKGADTNNDGIDDLYNQIDTDGDGIPNYLDTDSDNDGIPDAEEQLLVKLTNAGTEDGITDSDDDGIDDAVDVDVTGGIDANNDGIDDDLIDTSDLDGDGLLNYLDTNSDGDYMDDAIEYGDFNSDGVLDYLQVNGKVTTGVKGGGAMNSLWLMLLCGLAFFRFSNIKKKNLVALSAVVLSLLSINTQAQQLKERSIQKKACTVLTALTQPGCWYVGGGLGLSFVNPEPVQNSVWEVQENTASGIKLFSGLSLNKHWFAEFSYENLGSAQLSNLNPNVSPSTDSIAYSAMSLNAGLRLRGTEEVWDIYTKAGFTRLMTSDQETYIEQAHDSQVTLAVGAEWRLTKKWFTRLEFTSYDKDAKSLGIHISRYLGMDKSKPKKKKIKKKKAKKLQIKIKRPKNKRVIKPASKLPPPVMLAPVIVRPPKNWKRPSFGNLDQDGDGILDELDVCPKSPEYAEVDPRGCPLLETLILNVKFDGTNTLIKRKYVSEINRVAKMIKRFGNVHLTIEGHTDWRGTQSDNQPLSEARAAAVADMIKLKARLSSDNFTVVGYGELRPIADNSTAKGRVKNQRIVIIISQQ